MAKVESITKFGFVADGKKYRYEDVSIDRATIVPGAEIFPEDKPLPPGIYPYEEAIKHPIREMTKVVDTERAKVFTPKFNQAQAPSSTMSKDEWAQKDRRISRQGCLQVAVQVAATFEEAVKLADKMLAYVNEVK
jgi:hypothetical protein